jgi:hypothetical protein
MEFTKNTTLLVFIFRNVLEGRAVRGLEEKTNEPPRIS